MHKSISSSELKPILSRLPEINSIFQLNSICYARTNQDYERRVQEEKTQSILYWFTLPQGLRPVFSTPLAKKVPLIQLIVHIQLINQFLLPRNQEPY